MKKSKIFELSAVVFIVIMSILIKSSVIQTIAAITGIMYVFSVATEERSGQLFGVINSALYGYIMFVDGVYGTAIYNIVYCIPMQLYTFLAWGKDKEGKEKTEISRYSKVQRTIIILITTLIVCVYCIVAKVLDFNFVLIDGVFIILGFIGLYMTSKKKIEQWYCYVTSNLAMLILWSVKCTESISNIPMTLVWVIYIISNVFGFYRWDKKLKEGKNITV